MSGSEGGPGQALVLVVEDNPDDLEMLSALLRLEGYRVLPARDGDEALSQVQRTPPDLALVDVSLPDTDGLELCRRLRSWERTAGLPIILISAVRTREQDRIAALEVGADDLMLKPLHREILRARLTWLLRLRRVREELQEERNRLRALNYAVARLVETTAVEQLPAVAVTAAIGVGRCRQAACFLLDEPGRALHLAASEGLGLYYQRAFARLEVGTDLRTVALVEGTHLIADVQAGSHLQPYRETAAREGFRAVAEVPLRGAERVWGMLCLYYPRPRSFGENEVEVLVALARQVAVVLERLQHLAQEQHRRQAAEALQQVARIINASLDPAEVLPLILRQLRSVIPYRDAVVLLRREGSLYVAARQGEMGTVTGEAVLTMEQIPLLWETLTSGRPVVRSPAREDDAAPLLRTPPGSLMSVPLTVRGETIGLLVIASAYEGAYGEEITTVAQSFARQAAIAVENARLFQEVRDGQRKLEAILDQTTDAVLALDQERRILLVNPAARRLLGLPDGDLTGQPLAGVLSNVGLEALLEQAASSLNVVAEIAGVEERRLYTSVSPVAGVGYVAVAQDITPLKELEQMRLEAERHRQEQIRQTLARYVGPDLVQQVLAEEGSLLERRERVEAVVLFADIRGFTAAVAGLAPEAAVEVLNEFFTTMTRQVYAHEGTVIDLIGDELMASFGAPLARPGAARRAVETAIALQQVFTQLQQHWQKRWKIDVGLGVGIDRGSAVMGNVGTPERLSFTLIGNVVNRAHRLVEQAGRGEVLLSGEVLEAIPPAERGRWEVEEVAGTHQDGPPRVLRLRAVSEQRPAMPSARS